MTSADDEIRLLKEGWRRLSDYVPAELVARGWEVTDLGITDDAPLEFFWPPTAPTAPTVHGDWSDRADPATQPRLLPRLPVPTPWSRSTRIAREGTFWRVSYGEATAQEPDAPTLHATDRALLDDLPRIEWWPMSVKEARLLQNQRVLETTWADAYDRFSLGYQIRTAPYEIRLRELHEHMRGDGLAPTPEATWAGDLRARMRIIDGEAWASAVRTARAGGDDWDSSGPRTTDESR